MKSSPSTRLAANWVVLAILDVAAVVILALILLLHPNGALIFPGIHQQDFGIRVSLAQLVIEFVSVIALALGIWEFAKAQKKPRLKFLVKISESNGKEIFIRSGDTVELYDPRRNVYDSGASYLGMFTVYLENLGDAPARWIRVSLSTENPLERVRLIRTKDGKLAGQWTRQRNSADLLHQFNGGDDSICFSHPQCVDNVLEWCEEIGSFAVTIRPHTLSPENSFNIATIRLFVEAMECPRQSFEIHFHGMPVSNPLNAVGN